MLVFSSADLPALTSYCPVCFGGLRLFKCGIPPAIEESGAPAFRGGGGGAESREYGWYAVLVCILRFDDICDDCDDEKLRKTCWQGRREDVAGDEISRKMKLDGNANGAKALGADILSGS